MKVLVSCLAGIVICSAALGIAASENVKLAGQTGGAGMAIAVQDSRGVVGEGGGVRALDLTDPANPVAKGKVLLDNVNTFVNSLALQGNFACATARSPYVYMLNVADPDFPSVAGVLPVEGHAVSVTAREGRVFVGTRMSLEIDPHTNGFLYVFRIEGEKLIPESKTPVDQPVDTQCFFDKYILLGGQHSLSLVDISNPAAPQVRYTKELPLEIIDINAKGKWVFTSCAASGVALYDFSDPLNPDGPLESLLPPPFEGRMGVVLDVIGNGDYLYVAGGLIGVVVVDATTLPEYGFVKARFIPDAPFRIAMGNGYVYTTSPDNVVTAVSIADPVDPVQKGGYAAPGTCYHLRADAGGLVHVAATLGGYFDLDFAMPPGCEVVGHYRSWVEPWPTCEDVQPIGPNVILGNATPLPDNAIEVLSLADPTSPTQIGQTGLPEGSNARCIASSGNMVYMLTNGNTVHVFDCTDPVNPQTKGQFIPSETGASIQALGNTLYIGSNTGVIFIADVSDPDNPVETGMFDLAPLDVVFDIARRGNMLAVTGRPGFALLDVTSPTAPVLVSRVLYDEPNTWVTCCAFENTRLFVAHTDPSTFYEHPVVDVYDIADPAAPKKIGFYDEFPMVPESMTAAEGKVYVADWFGGVYMLQYLPTVCNLQLNVSNTPNPTDYNGVVTYKIDVTNNGPADAKHAILTDVVPGDGTVIGVMPTPEPTLQTGSVVTVTTVTVKLGTIAAGHTKRVEVTVRPNELGTLMNTASATADNAKPPFPVVETQTKVKKGNGPDMTGILSNVREVSRLMPGNLSRGRLTGTYLYRNIGNATAGQCRVRFFASDDEWLDPSRDTLIGTLTRSRYNVRPGQIINLPITYFEPSNVSLKGKYLIAWIEVLSMPPDSYSKNDVAVFGPIRQLVP
ncbi:MAG: hypothetical protein WCK47_12300 [bacterium]